MENFTPLPALAGGLLIGGAVSLLLLLNGRLAGASGILAGLVSPQRGDTTWRALFVVGLVIGTSGWLALTGSAPPRFDSGWPMIVLGGLLTGVGTRIGAGCTSGHGVCGIARLAPRSLVATGVFMAAGIATVFVARHLVGG
jgi:uncharacterized membrane protein YedE/YeeE